MARHLDPDRIDREQIGIAREFLTNPTKYRGAQLNWARAFLERIERERLERVEHDRDGQGLLFPGMADSSRYPD